MEAQSNGVHEQAGSILLRKAQEWREDMEGHVSKGGVVVLHEGQVQGWVNALRDPQQWQPGCIAVTEDGDCFKATGGNNQDGAVFWMPVICD